MGSSTAAIVPLTTWAPGSFYAEWAARDELILWQAAHLWADCEPIAKESIAINIQALPPPVKRYLYAMRRAVVGGSLPLVRVTERGERIVTRAGLKAYARSIGERPHFLFPSEPIRSDHPT